MARGRSQFVGLSGQYHTAYCLSVRGFHAAVTLGNVPDVDVLVASVDGSKVLSLQVKTARWAYRGKRYGHKLREWDVGGADGKSNPNWWYAFVDLQESGQSWTPKVFLVPSLWVGTFVQPRWKRKMFMLPESLWAETEEQWDCIRKFLDGDVSVQKWVGAYPSALTTFWDKPKQAEPGAAPDPAT
jgi:hypothetical protein